MVYPKSNTRAWVAYVDDVPGSMDVEGTSYASCAVGVQAEMQVALCGDQLVHIGLTTCVATDSYGIH